MRNKPQNSVCVQFSGGTDSTYVAYLMSLEFEMVHLVTFTHSYQDPLAQNKNMIVKENKSKISFDILNNKFPKKFKHIIIDVNDLMSQMLNRHHFKNLIKYRTINMFFGCFVCQACFHIKTIIYCLKNNIFNVRNGANIEYDDISPMQIKIVIKEINKFYLDYGIDYDSPIYYNHKEKRSDQLCYELGLFPERNIKGDESTYMKYQFYCKLGSCGGMGQQYWKHCKGYPKTIQTKLREHWIEEVPYLKSIINQELNSE